MVLIFHALKARESLAMLGSAEGFLRSRPKSQTHICASREKEHAPPPLLLEVSLPVSSRQASSVSSRGAQRTPIFVRSMSSRVLARPSDVFENIPHLGRTNRRASQGVLRQSVATWFARRGKRTCSVSQTRQQDNLQEADAMTRPLLSGGVLLSGAEKRRVSLQRCAKTGAGQCPSWPEEEQKEPRPNVG